MSNSLVPGSDLPARLPRAAQLRLIRDKARASEAVVDLLASLAFGDERPDTIVWPQPAWAGHTREIAHAA